MTTKTNAPMDIWLENSQRLLSNVRLLHPGGDELFGHGVEPAQFEQWVHEHSGEVDRLLVQLALAADGNACMRIIQGMARETVTVMCSRWAHYHHLWTQMRDRGEQQWMPADQGQQWRAVFLAMVSDPTQQSAAAQQLWEVPFPAPWGQS